MSSPIVYFRAYPVLLAALRNKVMRSDASVSPVIREALRENLEPGGEALVTFDPLTHLQVAAAAPVLDAARLAELRNPLGGIPPPPPDFAMDGNR